MTVYFDLYDDFRKQHDAEVFYEWLGLYVKGEAIVWRTEGDEQDEDGNVIPWQESEWTSVHATFDPSNPNVRPGGHQFRYPGWQCSAYEIMRVGFSSAGDARHFAAQYDLAPETL